jgi:hypothetical protein
LVFSKHFTWKIGFDICPVKPVDPALGRNPVKTTAVLDNTGTHGFTQTVLYTIVNELTGVGLPEKTKAPSKEEK